MSIATLLLIIVGIMLVAALPLWPHTKGWGYGPSGAAAAILAIVAVLVVLGRG